MAQKEKCYIAIDLKSFYASVECVERGLDPLTTNLVVADESRTEKTICLAVSPALKAYGIPGRARLFEVLEAVKNINADRFLKNLKKKFVGKSYDKNELLKHPEYALDFIIAKPQMAKYLEVSKKIYEIYLKYVAAEDVHVYSVDEVFIDATPYLNVYKMSGEELAKTMIKDVLAQTGITATAGIGTNLYLAKIAMDIVAKHMEPDGNGVREASLNEISYREKLWNHTPITDFWRVGRGYGKRLAKYGMHTMGDVAKCSVGGKNDFYNEELLYKIFGVNAEFLIDHAWGYEPCEIADIKNYRSENHSISNGQVLARPYNFSEGKTIVKEMSVELAQNLVSKRLTCDQIVLHVIYDVSSAKGNENIERDHYGRNVPIHAHGTFNLERTNSVRKIVDAATAIYSTKVNPAFFVRKIYVVAGHVKYEDEIAPEKPKQLDLFGEYKKEDSRKNENKKLEKKERNLTRAVLKIKRRYGKNSMLLGSDFEEGATGRARNEQIGGHRK